MSNPSRPQDPIPWADDITRGRLKEQFTNRDAFIQNFKSKLAYPPDTTLPVLMHCGTGGSGKSWIARHLMWQVCPQAGFDAQGRGFPWAYVTFRDGEVAPEPAATLGELRRDLQRNYKLRCPRFDLLWIYHYERTMKISIQHAPPSLLPDEWDTIADLLDATKEIPFIGDLSRVVRLLDQLGGRLAHWRNRRPFFEWFQKYIGNNWKDRLDSMSGRALADLLPKALAADLTEAAHALRERNTRAFRKQGDQISSPRPIADKIVLILDTYEAAQTKWRADDWVRHFAADLVDNQRPVLLVIGGQDRIRWPENDSWWGEGMRENPLGRFIGPRLEIWPVGSFSGTDSHDYLHDKRGLCDSTVISGIHQLTYGYPFLLDKAADWMMQIQDPVMQREALKDMEQVRRQLYDQMSERMEERWIAQREYNLLNTVRAAAVPRWFNKPLLQALLPGLRDSLRQVYPEMLGYASLEPGPLPETYRYHELERTSLLARMSDEDRQDWDQSACKYFAQQAGRLEEEKEEAFCYILEQIYHQFRVDEDAGCQLLAKHFFRHLQHYHLGEMMQLLAAVPEGLGPKATLHVQRHEADLLNRRGQGNDYEKADEIYRQILKSPQAEFDLQAAVASNLGRLLSDDGKLDQALDFYKLAQELDRRMGEYYDVLSTLGNVGNIWAQKGDVEKAIECHQKGAKGLYMLLEMDPGGESAVDQNCLDTLRQLLSEPLSDKDLRELCSNLGVSCNNLPADEVGEFEGLQTEDIDKCKSDLNALYNDLANDYLERGQKGGTERAIKELNRTIGLASGIKDDEGVAYAHATLAEAHLLKGDIDKAIDHWSKSGEIAERIGHWQLKTELAKILRNLDEFAAGIKGESAQKLLAEARK